MSNVKVVMQATVDECGHACLCMIANAKGIALELWQLRQEFPLGGRGLTLDRLIDHASSKGLASRPLRIELDDLRHLKLPCILHWNFNHYVVLSEVNRRSLTIVDPAIGFKKISWDDASKAFTGVALEFDPLTHFDNRPKRSPLRLEQVVGPLRGLAPALTRIFLLALGLEGFSILTPFLNQLVLDNVIPSGDMELLNIIGLGFGLLIIIQASIGLLRSRVIQKIQQEFNQQWSRNVFSHLLRLPIQWFVSRNLGDISTRFNAIHAIQEVISIGLVTALLDLIMCVGALTVMALYSMKLTALAMVAVLLFLSIRFLNYRATRSASAEKLAISSREQSHFLESIRSITTLRLFGKEQARLSDWFELLRSVQVRDFRVGLISNTTTAANTVIFGLEGVAAIWIAADTILTPTVGMPPFTIGMLFAYLSYKSQFVARANSLIDYFFRVRLLGVQTALLADITMTSPEPRASERVQTMDHIENSIEFRGVGFRYREGDRWILRNISFKLDPGQSLAIVGVSGAGKTTIIRLIMGLLQPTEGQILYGGMTLSQIGATSMRRMVIPVMQNDGLLAGTIAENISFFDKQPNSDRIETAAELASIAPDIRRLPLAYETRLSELGENLSGGQRQRIILARAFYASPKILVLDEATSHLDSGNEHQIFNAIERMGVTSIVVSHRKETVDRASSKLLLSRGRAVFRNKEHSEEIPV